MALGAGGCSFGPMVVVIDTVRQSSWSMKECYGSSPWPDKLACAGPMTQLTPWDEITLSKDLSPGSGSTAAK